MEVRKQASQSGAIAGVLAMLSMLNIAHAAPGQDPTGQQLAPPPGPYSQITRSDPRAAYQQRFRFSQHPGANQFTRDDTAPRSMESNPEVSTYGGLEGQPANASEPTRFDTRDRAEVNLQNDQRSQAQREFDQQRHQQMRDSMRHRFETSRQQHESMMQQRRSQAPGNDSRYRWQQEPESPGAAQSQPQQWQGQAQVQAQPDRRSMNRTPRDNAQADAQMNIQADTQGGPERDPRLGQTQGSAGMAGRDPYYGPRYRWQQEPGSPGAVQSQPRQWQGQAQVQAQPERRSMNQAPQDNAQADAQMSIQADAQGGPERDPRLGQAQGSGGMSGVDPYYGPHYRFAPPPPPGYLPPPPPPPHAYYYGPPLYPPPHLRLDQPEAGSNTEAERR